jgi:putative phage-type endonuclease
MDKKMVAVLEGNLPSDSPAVLLGSFQSGTPEWHEARATRVGGSDVGAICGFSKWESPLSLWAKKSGLISSDIPESEPMEWGTLLEPVVLSKFRRMHPELNVVANVGTYVHRDRDWQLANPDALAYNPSTGEYHVIEIKTARYEDEWDEKENVVPLTYRAQVQWYMQTLGIKHTYVATLFSGSKYREFSIDGNEFEQDANLARVIMWRDYLTSGTQPDFDGAEATYEVVRELHPEIDDTLDCELGELGVHYDIANAEFVIAERQLREMKSRVLDAMGKAKRGLVEGEVLVTRQARGQGLPYLVNKKG